MVRLIANSGCLASGICVVLMLGCGKEAAETEAVNESSTETVRQGPNPLTFDLDGVDPAVADLIRDSRSAVRADARSSEAWGQLGKLLLAHDLFEAAASCFAEASRFGPRDPRWPYFAAIAIKTADPAAAVDRMRDAVERLGPQAAEPRIRFADLLLEVERVDEAEEIITSLLALKPEEARAYVTLAKIQLIRNQPREALQSLDRRSGNQRPTRQGLLLAAEAHRRLGEPQEAKKKSALAARVPDVGLVDPYFSEVLKLRTGLKASLSLADQLYVQNRVDESIQILERVVRDYPESEWAHILLGRGLIRMRRIPDAQTALNDAIKQNPTSFEAHFRMGVSYQVSGQPDRAAEWFEKSVALQPASAVSYKNLGVCRYALKDMEAAEAALKKSVSVHPNYFDGYLTLGDFYAKQGRYEESRQTLQLAQRLRPEDPRIPAMIRQLDEQLELRKK